MRTNSKKSKQNSNYIIPVIVGVCLITGAVIATTLINNNKVVDTDQSRSSQQNETDSTLSIPENLVTFNKCRVLKMIDDYIAIKNDRTKREFFNSYKVIDDKTIPCLEERSQDVVLFNNSIKSSWNARQDEEFLNNIQTPRYFLDALNEKYNKKMTLSQDRDTELKYFALYYTYWGTLRNFDPSMNHFMSYQYAKDLVFEAGATYTATNNGLNLTITLPYSGQEIAVTQDTDKDSAPTPKAISSWSGEWWNEV